MFLCTKRLTLTQTHSHIRRGGCCWTKLKDVTWGRGASCCKKNEEIYSFQSLAIRPRQKRFLSLKHIPKTKTQCPSPPVAMVFQCDPIRKAPAVTVVAQLLPLLIPKAAVNSTESNQQHEFSPKR